MLVRRPMFSATSDTPFFREVIYYIGNIRRSLTIKKQAPHIRQPEGLFSSDNNVTIIKHKNNVDHKRNPPDPGPVMIPRLGDNRFEQEQQNNSQRPFY